MISRRTTALAMAATAAIALSGCAAAATEPGDDAGSNAPSGELAFATWQFLEPNRGDAIFDAINAYTEQNSEVSFSKVEVARADYEKTLSTQFGAGAGPDIFVIPDAFFPQLVDAGILEPLDAAVKDSGSSSFRNINENYAVDGTQYGVVWEVVPYSLYWNKDILEASGAAVPTNVAELVTAANTIKSATGKTGFTVRHQMNEETPWWTDYSNWTFGYGGAWSDGKNLTIDNPKNVEALEAFASVYAADGFGKGQDASTYRSAFAAGELGMAIDNSSAVLTQVSDAVPADRIGSAVLPFPAGGSAYAGFSLGVNANSKNKEAALDFVRWMLTDDSQKNFADALFPSAVATEAEASADLISANPWTSAFFEQVKDASSVIIPGFEERTAEIRTIVLTEVARVVAEGADPAEALAKAQEQAEALVK